MIGILKRPIVTEKMTALQEKGQYAFEVNLTANKILCQCYVFEVFQKMRLSRTKITSY